ncbi:PLDc_N domain-containing protein [Mangrovimonas sp. CR14]|uniref:PLD nuclease N-terminal domain-containing protein n=1 Tax=Mangrovimonas sp. CR14 TaxID=2706120 RepID=UPI0014244CD9|nr:PLD nuclease N-terminal domain-containing protein [Mangrovimonas sp. CR14]NIK91236.1 PLDc_N domain-containing protein [Mangrovimonas sp. CR14]
MAFFLLVFLCLSFLLFPIAAIVSLLNKTVTNNDKLIWILIVLFLPIIGSILYFVIGRPKFKALEIRNSNRNYFKY